MALIPDPKKKVEAFYVEPCCRDERHGWWWVVSSSYFVATFHTRDEAEEHAGRLNSGRILPSQA